MRAVTPSIRRPPCCWRKFWKSTVCPAKVEPPELLTVGGILHLPGSGAQIICLSYVGADVRAPHVRYAIRRLRRRLPEAKIIAGFWRCDPDAARDLCAQTRAGCLPDLVGRGGGFLRRGGESGACARGQPAGGLPRGPGPRRAAPAALPGRRLRACCGAFMTLD